MENTKLEYSTGKGTGRRWPGTGDDFTAQSKVKNAGTAAVPQGKSNWT